MKKFILIAGFLITSLLAAAPTSTPSCGTTTINSDSARISTPLGSIRVRPRFDVIMVRSFDGWSIESITSKFSGIESTVAVPTGTIEWRLPFPPGKTQGDLNSISVKLVKDCNSGPKFTGRYVYTLFGDYPCNLISTESTIPARFLNPDYTASLCSLPNLPHSWNGEWVKNKEMEQNGFFTAGNHYDTSLDVLP